MKLELKNLKNKRNRISYNKAMKSLRFDHNSAQMILAGKKHSTWRVDDDKDLRVDDQISIVDKVSPNVARSWEVIGTGKINIVTEKRLGEINEKDYEVHEKYSSRQELIKTFRQYYGPQVNESTPVKIIEFSFTPGYIQSADDAANIIMKSIAEVKIYADGGSRGNPGPSASGFVITDMNDVLLEKDGLYLGITTNNQAEYHALRLAMEKALSLNVETVHVFMDSLLVVNQMKGLYKIKNTELLVVHQTIKQLAAHFKRVEYTHIPREFNKAADAMVNEVLDSTDL